MDIRDRRLVIQADDYYTLLREINKCISSRLFVVVDCVLLAIAKVNEFMDWITACYT